MLVPMVFMLIMAAWAMLINVKKFHAGANRLLFRIGPVVFYLRSG
jgi:hypothetical protein